jgi:CheY-like chemotaxis protein
MQNMSSLETSHSEKLVGLRVLIVEDEPLVAILLQDILDEFGCEIAGPAYSLEEAVAAARTEERINLAILDVNLRGAPVYPVAEVLVERGIRFVFASGYGTEGVDEKWRDRLSLPKPFTAQDVARVLVAALDGPVPKA